MTVLAISTSSPALSIALVDGPCVLARRHELIGRGHAEALVPAIAELLGAGRPDAIIVDIGPGSYTGIRIGIAAARALGAAWGVPVHGVSALSLVAAQAFAADPALAAVFALIDAGRGHAAGALVTADLVVPVPVLMPVLMPLLPDGAALAGAGAALLPGTIALHLDHPDAAFAGRLPAAALGLPQALYAGD
ncbi:tRNA (adenosine(37)-N6)-threonylcarbamoyltransferase complex dimerization subunit type 1 TsaB [Sandarakinorhabdus sp.]|uniref:tRNA (adenosine(37)-N6)-threonylcarbamoyltransferase complex dimerization subunit type 1 TsaB n=1 Tax=Sandarakinorhabdus sp. TaxID=1916663 RepID=UPI0035685CEA